METVHELFILHERKQNTAGTMKTLVAESCGSTSIKEQRNKNMNVNINASIELAEYSGRSIPQTL